MARQSNTVVKVLGAGFAVIAGGAAFGYLFGSARLPHPPVQTTPPSVSATLPLTSAPKLNPSLIHPHTANGNYTAPGAPRITIEEQSEPILRRVTPPPAPAADPEASQEATVTPPKTTVPETAPADTTSASSDGTSSTSPSPDASPGTSAPAVSPPPSPPAAPADPDFERVNTPKPSPSDPEAGQQGDKTPGKSQTNTFPENGVRRSSGSRPAPTPTKAMLAASPTRSAPRALRPAPAASAKETASSIKSRSARTAPKTARPKPPMTSRKKATPRLFLP